MGYQRDFPVIIERDETGVFCATCPVLPAAISAGRTYEEALANIREAIELALECWPTLPISPDVQAQLDRAERFVDDLAAGRATLRVDAFDVAVAQSVLFAAGENEPDEP